jgi:hypothetical protein
MPDPKQYLDLAHATRAQALHALTTLSQIIEAPQASTLSKLHAARAITHLAQAAAAITRLRRDLAQPGGQP